MCKSMQSIWSDRLYPNVVCSSTTNPPSRETPLIQSMMSIKMSHAVLTASQSSWRACAELGPTSETAPPPSTHAMKNTKYLLYNGKMRKRMDDKYLQKSTSDLQNKYQDAQDLIWWPNTSLRVFVLVFPRTCHLSVVPGAVGEFLKWKKLPR